MENNQTFDACSQEIESPTLVDYVDNQIKQIFESGLNYSYILNESTLTEDASSASLSPTFRQVGTQL